MTQHGALSLLSPGDNAGYQPPPLWREPPLGCPIGHGVDRHEGEAVAASDGEDNQPEGGVERQEGGGVARTEDSIMILLAGSL